MAKHIHRDHLAKVDPMDTPARDPNEDPVLAGFQTATSFGGPYVLLPKRLFTSWGEEIGENANTDSGMYGEVCNFSRDCVLAHVIPFLDAEVVRLCVMPDDIYWVPLDYGGLVVQWFTGDSSQEFLDYMWETVAMNQWEERIEFEVHDREFLIMDSLGDDRDGQPKIHLTLEPGLHRVESLYRETSTIDGYILRISRTDSKGLTVQTTA